MNTNELISYNPIMLGKRARRLRMQQGISIEKMAAMTGVNKNTVVRFEKGLGTRLNTINKICQALKTTPLHLMEERLVEGRDFDIIKRLRDDDGNPLWEYSKGKSRELKYKEEGMLLGDIDYKLPGGRINGVVLEVYGHSRIRNHPGEEFIFCLKGALEIKLGNQFILLEKGDSLFFWGSENHGYVNAHPTLPVSVALSVCIDTEMQYENLNFVT